MKNKFKINQVILTLSIIIIFVWMVMRSRRRDRYDENATGPAPAITQAELNAVMKFIK